MLVRLSPAARIIPPNDATGNRWVVDDLLRKRRFTVTRSIAAVLAAAAEPTEPGALAARLARFAGVDGGVEAWSARISDLVARSLLVDAESISADPDQQWLLELVEEWDRAGWREAAEYHFLAFDYPCVDYSEAAAIGIDQSRMRDYQAVEPDDDRYKEDYLERPGIDVPEPHKDIIESTPASTFWTGSALKRPLSEDAFLATVSLAFGVIRERVPITDSAPLLRRTSPSGGGRHPTEGYVAVRQVPGMRSGWYHVTTRPLSLRLVRSDGVDEKTIRSVFPNIASAAAIVVVTSVFERNMYRYREPRTFRTVHMDAGHVAGTVRLAAESAGLRAVVDDATDAPTVESLLGLDGMAEGYLMSVGLWGGVESETTEARPAEPAEPAIIHALPPEPIRPDGVHWPVGTRIRPVAQVDKAEIEVADTVTGRTTRHLPVDLAEAILRDERPHADLADPADEVRRAALVPGLRHWQRRGWHPSDQLYVASRRPGGRPAAADADPSGAPAPTEPPGGRQVALPDPADPADVPISRLLLSRRSGRSYVRRPVPAAVLSGLLRYGLAHLRDGDDAIGAGWVICVAAYRVSGVEPGAYRYHPREHSIELVRAGDLRTDMIAALQGMRSPSSASWTLGLVADFPAYQRRRPGETGLRSLYTWSGAVAQDLIVLGAGYGLSTLVTPAQQDSAYLAMHGLSRRRHGPIYTLTMGVSRGAAGVYPDEDPLGDELTGASR
ncbi:SagB/ThcOx family dehydrogenase [Actinosynnema sp. NPDC049800]